MQVTPIHRERAAALVTRRGTPPPVSTINRPAVSGYLAAVERLGAGGPTIASIDFTDATGDTGSLYVLPMLDVSQGPALDAARVRMTLRDDPDDSMVVHAFTPDEARARAYELLVLADLAEEATS